MDGRESTSDLGVNITQQRCHADFPNVVAINDCRSREPMGRAYPPHTQDVAAYPLPWIAVLADERLKTGSAPCLTFMFPSLAENAKRTACCEMNRAQIPQQRVAML